MSYQQQIVGGGLLFIGAPCIYHAPLMYNVMYGYQVCRQRSVFRSQSGQKYVGGRGSITDPAEGAYSALPDPLAGGSPLSMTILFEEGRPNSAL